MLALRGERETELRIAVATLPEPYREVVTLRFFGEMSLEEIAQTDRTPCADRQDPPSPRPAPPAQTVEAGGTHERSEPAVRPRRASHRGRGRSVPRRIGRGDDDGPRARGACGERRDPADRRVRGPGDGCDRRRARAAPRRPAGQPGSWRASWRVRVGLPRRMGGRLDGRPPVRGPGSGARVRPDRGACRRIAGHGRGRHRRQPACPSVGSDSVPRATTDYRPVLDRHLRADRDGGTDGDRRAHRNRRTVRNPDRPERTIMAVAAAVVAADLAVAAGAVARPRGRRPTPRATGTDDHSGQAAAARLPDPPRPRSLPTPARTVAAGATAAEAAERRGFRVRVGRRVRPGGTLTR